MNFFKKIGQSIYSPAFYTKVLSESTGPALGYFFLFTLLLTILRAIFFAPLVINGVHWFTNTLVPGMVNAYPQKLQFTVHNGMVSINQPEPFIIPNKSGEDQMKNFIVIDTKVPFSEQQYEAYNTDIWITRDTIFYKESNGEIRAAGLSKFQDFTLNRKDISDAVKTITPFFMYIVPVLIVFVLIGTYISYLPNLVMLFIMALLVWLLATILKKKMGYMQSYRVGIYLITTGLLIDAILAITYPWLHLVGFPFMVMLISLIVFLINVTSGVVKRTKKVNS